MEQKIIRQKKTFTFQNKFFFYKNPNRYVPTTPINLHFELTLRFRFQLKTIWIDLETSLYAGHSKRNKFQHQRREINQEFFKIEKLVKGEHSKGGNISPGMRGFFRGELFW